MNRDESIALWRQGKDAWNTWAAEMLRQKNELEQAGTWQADGQGEAQNEETREWIAAASADFVKLQFIAQALSDEGKTQARQQEEGSQGSGPDNTLTVDGSVIGFEGFVFPWQVWFWDTQFQNEARFDGAQFHGEAWFWCTQFHGQVWFQNARFRGRARLTDAQFHNEARFEGAQFGEVWFLGAQFNGETWFQNAQFRGEAWLADAKFHRRVSFDGAKFHRQVRGGQFHGDAWFENTEFRGEAWFTSSKFQGLAWFKGAEFNGEAWFADAQFQGGTFFRGAQFRELARFRDATFKASSSFEGSKFGNKENPQDADFTAIKVERAFDMAGARFSKGPAFNQANFIEAPDLDGVSYPFPPFIRWIRGFEGPFTNVRRAEKFMADAAKYRHLRRLAILGHDHENEAKAFKGETRAKRGTEHLPWHAAFWFGIAYDALSDFGRSMMRPFYVWLFLTLLFGVFYFAKGSAHSLWECVGAANPADKLDASVTPLWEAIYLAVKNGLIFMGLGTEGKIGQAHACLYGGTISAPIYPSVLSIAQLAQNFLSAPLIFLFLLGVRNQFKIK